MKFNIEIEIDDKDDIKVSAPSQLLAKLFKYLAMIVPKGLDAFFATSFGVFHVLGARRYFELAMPIIKAAIPNALANLRRKQNAGTERGATKGTGEVSKGEVSSSGLGQKGA